MSVIENLCSPRKDEYWCGANLTFVSTSTHMLNLTLLCVRFFHWDKLLERRRENMMKKKEEEQTMDRAEYVPHPDGEGYALFLHDSFHLLSQEDMNQPEEE
ncbi:hypothetical protein CTV96_05630 [Bacillus altitudinis]|nr:hypothetical protein CTV96_05630 [Bacillus altitudinis]